MIQLKRIEEGAITIVRVQERRLGTANVGELVLALTTESHTPWIVLDLSHVQSMDSTAVQSINCCQGAVGSMEIVVGPQLARLFSRFGVAPERLHGSLEVALEAHSRSRIEIGRSEK